VKPAGEQVKLKVPYKSKGKRTYQGIYNKVVLDTLVHIWKVFNRQSGKLFAPFIHTSIDHITLELRFKATDKATAKLCKTSASPIDRLLKPLKVILKIKGTSGTAP